eukprot:tig00001376_g8537.t1
MLRRLVSNPAVRRIHSSAVVRAAEAAAPAGSTKLNLNFVCPHLIIAQNKPVDMVTLPGQDGMFGVLPNHVPTVAQLKPGVVAIHDGSSVQNYFVSSGFALIHPDRTDVCAVEAVKVEDIDPEAVKRGMAEYNAALASATSDADKAKAQIGAEVYSAMNVAIGGSA